MRPNVSEGTGTRGRMRPNVSVGRCEKGQGHEGKCDRMCQSVAPSSDEWRRRTHIVMTDQSDAGSMGIFS
eukprot:4713941-Pyramimonas_sp.AAC.1